MSRVGIVAAFAGELKPLVRGWMREGNVWSGRIGEHEAVATCAGMGAAARRGCEVLAAAGRLDLLISIGWAGSLSCGLKPPVACAVREVVDAATGEAFATENGEGQRLITVDRVAGPEEKRRLAQAHQAALVDMEAARVGRFAREQGIRFLCFKAVTDGPNEKLPDFSRFTGSDGQLRVAALGIWAAWHPKYWGTLRRLGENSGRAAEELAGMVGSSLPRVLPA